LEDTASLDAPTVPDSIRRLAGRLGAERAVRRVVLFGSRARGEAHPRADVDLAVDAPQATRREWIRLTEIVEEADTLLPIDLVWLEEAPDELRARILAEGRTLFER